MGITPATRPMVDETPVQTSPMVDETPVQTSESIIRKYSVLLSIGIPPPHLLRFYI